MERLKRIGRALIGPVALTILGILLTVAFGVWAIWVYVLDRTPSLAIENLSQVPVLQINQPLADLRISYKDSDLVKEKMQITAFTVRIINSGHTNIHANDFDPLLPLTVHIDGGALIQSPLVQDASDGRFSQESLIVLANSLAGAGITERKDNAFSFKPFLIDSGEWFNVSFLLIHKSDRIPELSVTGKVSGINKLVITSGVQAQLPQPLFAMSLIRDVLISLIVVFAATLMFGIAAKSYKRRQEMVRNWEKIESEHEQRLTELELRAINVKVTCEFIDGPWAGLKFVGDSLNPQGSEAAEAAGLYWVTHGGKVGKRFQGLTPEQRNSLGRSISDDDRKALFAGGPMIHEVIERIEKPGEVLIRLKHVPSKPTDS